MSDVSRYVAHAPWDLVIESGQRPDLGRRADQRDHPVSHPTDPCVVRRPDLGRPGVGAKMTITDGSERRTASVESGDRGAKGYPITGRHSRSADLSEVRLRSRPGAGWTPLHSERVSQTATGSDLLENLLVARS